MTRQEMIANFDDPGFPETAAEFASVGRANAETALDQGGLADHEVIADYADNLLDTLAEMGVEDGHPVIYAATEAFLDVLRAKGIAYRPHGF